MEGVQAERAVPPAVAALAEVELPLQQQPTGDHVGVGAAYIKAPGEGGPEVQQPAAGGQRGQQRPAGRRGQGEQVGDLLLVAGRLVSRSPARSPRPTSDAACGA